MELFGIYTYSFFDNICHTVCEKTAIHSLVCVLRSLGLHFHEGVEKIKENDKNTKIENLQNGREKPRVRVQLGQKLKKIIISSNFSLKLL